MKVRTALLAGASIAILIIFVAAVVNVPPAHDHSVSSSAQVVSDRGQLDMLVSDQRMLNLMRAEVSTNMETMIARRTG